MIYKNAIQKGTLLTDATTREVYHVEIIYPNDRPYVVLRLRPSWTPGNEPDKWMPRDIPLDSVDIPSMSF